MHQLGNGISMQHFFNIIHMIRLYTKYQIYQINRLLLINAV